MSRTKSATQFSSQLPPSLVVLQFWAPSGRSSQLRDLLMRWQQCRPPEPCRYRYRFGSRQHTDPKSSAHCLVRLLCNSLSSRFSPKLVHFLTQVVLHLQLWLGPLFTLTSSRFGQRWGYLLWSAYSPPRWGPGQSIRSAFSSLQLALQPKHSTSRQRRPP